MMSDMEDLVAWLLRQIEHDEWVARGAARASGLEQWTPVGLQSPFDARVDDHIATWGPDRALAECAAKRHVIDLWRHADRHIDVGSGANSEQRALAAAVSYIDDALLAAARPYAGRDGWRQEWAQ